MNERIKQLAEQAMIFSHENGGWRISTHVPNDFQEKFAKLIVKECVQACINEGKTYAVKSAGEYQAELFSNAIKEHFGVE